MFASLPARLARWGVAIAIVAALAAPVFATITDDITPFGTAVYAPLTNLSTVEVQGTVMVAAEVDGKMVGASSPFRIGAGGQLDVSIPFPGRSLRSSVSRSWRARSGALMIAACAPGGARAGSFQGIPRR